MAVEDDVRKKSHELHSLTQELQEHLSSGEEVGWMESKVHGTLGKLRKALESMESELDIDPSEPPPEEAEEPAPDQEPAAPQAAGPESKAPGALTPEDFRPIPGQGLDVSVLRNVDASELQRVDVSELQKKFADDPEFVRQFIEGTSFAAFGRPGGIVSPRSAFPRPGEMPTPPALRDRPGGQVASVQDLGGGGDDGDGSSQDSGDPSPGATSLDAFFSKVGSSLVAAQRQLDQRSKEYMADLDQAGMGRDLATLYRIPKVNAELKFALEDVSTEKLNLVIHSQGTQASTRNQQSVQFEIAAVPAPPEALDAARRLAPRLTWVFDPPRRGTIFQALAEAGASALPLDRPDRVLIVELAESNFLLAHAEPEVGGPLSLVHLDLSAGADWNTFFKVDGAGPDVPPPLRAWMASLCKQQAAFLAGF